jgi:hypothetical protein
VATDPDAPGQTLAFSLDAGAPDGAAIVRETGLFSWTPGAIPGFGNYPVTVRVTDDGYPPLSATRTFTVTVVPPPALAESWNGSQLTLSWPTIVGRVYRLEYKDDLGAPAWTALGSNFTATSTLYSTVVATSAVPQRFYRVVAVN